MADLRFNPKNRSRRQMIDRTYPCRISRFLDAYGIPNVLWGELVMNMILIPLEADGIYFVIPDEHIDKARDLLLEAGFPPCQLGKYCGFDHPNSCHGIPYAHFNIVDLGPLDCYKPEQYGPNPRQWYTLELYKKSELLWAAPEIPLGIPPANDPDYWTVKDKRLPKVAIEFRRGRVVNADYPVKIPSPARYAESLTLLFFRDNYPEETIRGLEWDTLLDDMEVVMDEYRLFKLEDLPPRTRSWFKILTETPRERTHGDAEERFGAEMREAGEVPEKSPWLSEAIMPAGWHEELKEYDEMIKKKKEEEEEEQMRKKEEEVKEEQNA
ncbi:uncharacterized protein CDV56_103345 [Aspergillus thermomutatus]|uniref:Uncharacterized protein n=1 Tax=Aspergillus thermomutatus TaxID=41047 RepID=A0A397G075_ASPTH|nr:uncharacterized protein CDV56_103345 [Aspergillus thermomutatus]RHZ44421.1 hypothetical protein CDV56_103345 [Aspergillus thermomutatus]